MAFDASPGEEDFKNTHDFDAARRRLIEVQRHANKTSLQFGLFGDEIAVDLFAGAGGASLGLRQALGRPCSIEINHDPAAIAVLKMNVPEAEHYTSDVFEVDPVTAVRGRPVGILWLSPTCTHFSTARSGRPLDYQQARKIRGLAWVGVRWAKAVRPRIIMCENVKPFLHWCRVGRDGRADKSRVDRNGYGEYFKKWVRQLRALGYSVEWRVLSAADYGAPTIRERVFIIARCDGLPIVWPDASHGPGRDQPYRTAAECIDWSLRSASIFMGKADARKLGVKRPLEPPTLARIAKGLVKYVLTNPTPYVVPNGNGQGPFLATLNHSGDEFRGQGLTEPMATITAARDAHGLVIPHITRFRTGSVGASVSDPLNTITSGQGSKRPAGHAHAMGLVEAEVSAATLIQTGYGEREGQEPRALDLGKPLGTIVAAGVKHAVIEASLRRGAALIAIDHQGSGDSPTFAVDEPLRTITKENRHAIAEASFIAQMNEDAIGRAADEPLATLTKTCSQQQIVTAHLTNFYSSNTAGGESRLEKPMTTITASGLHQGVVTVELEGEDLAKARRVARFLKKYYEPGKKGVVLSYDMERGLVIAQGVSFQIMDVKLRMLTVPELKKAQGFPDSYRLDPECWYRTKKGMKFGVLPQSEQVAKIGNSVCPQVARALAEANLFHERIDQVSVPRRRARAPAMTPMKRAA